MSAYTWCSHAGSLQLQLRHHLYHMRPLRPASNRSLSSVSNTNIQLVNVIFCQWSPARSPSHGTASFASLLLTVSLFARGPRWFSTALRGLPSLLPSGSASAGRYELRGLATLHRGREWRAAANTAGFVSDAKWKLTLCCCHRRSCSRPGLGRRSCRSPPLLLLCVGGGGPTTSHIERV